MSIANLVKDFRGEPIAVGDLIAYPTLSPINKIELTQYMVKGFEEANVYNPGRLVVTDTSGRIHKILPEACVVFSSMVSSK
jgi:hypothetical protein